VSGLTDSTNNDATDAGALSDRMFAGVRVLEVAQWVFAPAAAAVLAAYGAEVVKVEHPKTGDPYRNLYTASLGTGRGKVNERLEQNNFGKRSITLDLQTPAGRKILLDLVKRSDVFLTNYRRDSLRRMALDPEDLWEVNPAIIYAQATGYGRFGPHANRPAYDASAYWARGGVASLLTSKGAARPPGQRPAMGDHVGAMNMAFGIAAALYRRARTGRPSVVNVSLLATAMYQMSSDVVSAFNEGYDENARAANPLSDLYQTRDGRWLALVFTEPDRYWSELCRCLDRPDLSSDPRFVDTPARDANASQCREILKDIFSARDYEEWIRIIPTFDAPWEPVQTVVDLYRDPQVLSNRFLVPVDGHGEEVKIVAPPVEFDQLPIAAVRRAPEFGEHTEEILLELGLGWPDVEALRAANVIF
jgi:crotonobetainyl-CoA:carnitine CoA-transferase CaiB-like acyl-CoA transferase